MCWKAVRGGLWPASDLEARWYSAAAALWLEQGWELRIVLGVHPTGLSEQQSGRMVSAVAEVTATFFPLPCSTRFSPSSAFQWEQVQRRAPRWSLATALLASWPVPPKEILCPPFSPRGSGLFSFSLLESADGCSAWQLICGSVLGQFTWKVVK